MISIIIPAFNEAENILPLYERLVKTLKQNRITYEIIFIDDGSNDKTSIEIEKLNKIDRQVKLISFSRNYGKSAAMQQGFETAKGEILITMDADLQDIPEEIPNFLRAIKYYDLVVGWRYKRKDRITKRIASLIFNKLGVFITGLSIHDANCGFKAMKKHVAKSIDLYGELHRYLPTIAYLKGFKVGEIKIQHAERLYGTSKYGISRMWRGFFDLLSVKFLGSFSRKPFHFFGGVGLISLITGSVIGGWLLALWLLTGTIGGHTPAAILSMLLIILGVQLISLGLLAEMIASIKGRETQNIKRKI